MNNIVNLVFQGGSVKGVAYLGALRALEKEGKLEGIRRVAGTSVGAITAAFLAVGCTVKELEELLLDFEFSDVLDDKQGGIPTQSKVLKTLEKKSQEKPAFFSKIPAKSVKGVIGYRLADQFGIYEGEYVRIWLEEIIQQQVKKLTNSEHTGENLTFKELHQLTLDYPRKFRDLFVVGVNLNTGKKTTFSYDNSEMEDVIIADAIRISMSIPYLFKPHHVYYKIDNKRLVDAKRHIWVDGGIYDNYPIRCFDYPKYCSQPAAQPSSSSIFYNPETLGFRLVSKAHHDYFKGLRSAPENEINNLLAFSKALLGTIFARQEDEHDAVNADKLRTIYINHLGISFLAFNLSEQQKKELKNSGQRATELFLTGKSDIPAPTDEGQEVQGDILPEEIGRQYKV